jgi:hypothetical protein
MQNLILEGKGVITQRPGTATLYTSSPSPAGKIRGLFGSNTNDTNELLSISDYGYLTIKNGDSYTTRTGASWASGYQVSMAQLGNKVYIVQPNHPLVYYSSPTLTSYTTILAPFSLMATNMSGVTGNFTYSWRVAAVTDVGRTLASDPVLLSKLPENLDKTFVRLSWAYPSGASGLIKGWEIYGRDSGSETRLTGSAPSATTWDDDGTNVPSLISGLPDFNETAGPSAKYIVKSVGKIVVANLSAKKSRFMWSGADINAGKFSWTVGGGYQDVDSDSEDSEVTGVVEVDENKFVVWKQHSIYQIKLSYNSDLGIVESSLTKLTSEVGAVPGRTVASALNNHFFLGIRPGEGISVNSIGYEPNIAAAVLRTANMSKVIQQDLEACNMARLDECWAVVYQNVYWFFFPVGTSEMRCYGYDLERLCFHGPHTFPENPVIGTVWYDSINGAHMLLGGDSGHINEVSKRYKGDLSVPFAWSWMSKKEDFKLPFKLKTLLKSYIHLADVQGGTVSAEVLTESDEGLTSTVSSISVDAPSKYAGFGSFLFGHLVRFGADQESTSTTNTSDVRRYADLNEPNILNSQLKISSSDGASAKIIETMMTARPQPGDSSNWRSE